MMSDERDSPLITHHSSLATGPRILIAGIGNIFFGDDAFGCEVAKELATRPLPPEVRVIDFGIRSYDLAYAMMEDYAATILVDASPGGGDPGTLYLIEPDLKKLDECAEEAFNAHSMNPVRALQLVRSLGGEPRGVYVVGCEPDVLEREDGTMGLSEKVQLAIPGAIALIEKLVADLLNGRTISCGPVNESKNGCEANKITEEEK